MAVLVDNAMGEMSAASDLRRSGLLRNGHILTLPLYANKPAADMEDVIGWRNYLTLVNKAYGLVGTTELKDEERPEERVARVVEERFRNMPTFQSGFSRYTASEYFIRHRDAVFTALPEVPPALDRFEEIFRDLNHLLEQNVAQSEVVSRAAS